ncbi:hypothetical protein AB0B01_00310 [Streptomyces sp. NPDC044571]|uniref:hypothetical protein n=1 Tax=Streptomyces sp. NPDC044571 TaxID=3155371 RepID=UPI0033E3E7CE
MSATNAPQRLGLALLGALLAAALLLAARAAPEGRAPTTSAPSGGSSATRASSPATPGSGPQHRPDDLGGGRPRTVGA